MDIEREPDAPAVEPEAADLDPGADTGRFQAFAAGGAEDGMPGPVERGGGSTTTFRLLTLLGGLVAFAAIVWLLLR